MTFCQMLLDITGGKTRSIVSIWWERSPLTKLYTSDKIGDSTGTVGIIVECAMDGCEGQVQSSGFAYLCWINWELFQRFQSGIACYLGITTIELAALTIESIVLCIARFNRREYKINCVHLTGMLMSYRWGELVRNTAVGQRVENGHRECLH